MKKYSTSFILLLSSIWAWGQASEIAVAPTDNFQFSGTSLHHYGVGFHSYLGGTNMYGAGYYGINLFTSGQNRFRIDGNGFVGIGTGTSGPLQKLHIAGGNLQIDLPVMFQQSKSFLIFGDGNDHVIQGQAWTGSGNLNVKTRISFTQKGLLLQYPKSFDAFGTSTEFETGIFLSSGYYGSEKGNVGIGTTTPTVKLDVRGAIKANGISLINWHNTSLGYTNNSIVMNGTRDNDGWKLYGDGARSSIGIITTDIFGNMRFVTHSDPSQSGGKTMTDTELILPNTKMLITSAGNVGIGTSSPTNKLEVNGTIRAKEIKVDAVNWPDYVFSDQYNLKALAEIEQYIKAHKHLPNVPSAKEMEANGVDLAEMNKLLLQKIEELTLYAIQKDEQIGSLKTQVELGKQEVEGFAKRLAIIETLILKDDK